MEKLAKIAFLLTAISPGQLLAVTGDYEIRHGTYYSYVECLGEPVEKVSVLQSRAAHVLTETSLEAIWLPLHRRHLGGWFWLTGQFHAAKLSRKTEKFGRDCGALRAADLLLDDTMCDRLYKKYLCQQQGENCPASRKDCLNHGGRTYWLYSGVNITWYDARTLCTQKEQQLSTLPQESRDVVMKWLQASITSYYDVWIGLRRSDYFLPGYNTSVDIFKWTRTDSCACESRHDCVILKRGASNLCSWVPQSCNAAAPYMCREIKNDSSSRSSQRPSKYTEIEWTSVKNPPDICNCSYIGRLHVEKTGLGTPNAGFKTACIIISVVALVTIGITIFCILWRFCYLKKDSGQVRDRNKLTGESKLLELEPLKATSHGPNKKEEDEGQVELERLKEEIATHRHENNQNIIKRKSDMKEFQLKMSEPENLLTERDQTIEQLNVKNKSILSELDTVKQKQSITANATLVSNDTKGVKHAEETLRLKQLTNDEQMNQEEIAKLSKERETITKGQQDIERLKREHDSMIDEVKNELKETKSQLESCQAELKQVKLERDKVVKKLSIEEKKSKQMEMERNFYIKK